MSAESQDRTDDPTIFSRVLYLLSYLGLYSRFSGMLILPDACTLSSIALRQPFMGY
jgi:hypothetical protein